MRGGRFHRTVVLHTRPGYRFLTLHGLRLWMRRSATKRAFYEVEVRRGDGSQVDVHLDKHFNVIDQADDGDRGGEDEQGADND